MDRLTKRTSSGTFLNVETKTGGIVVSRLAAYEDTGFMPGEIDRICEELERYKKWVNDLQSGMYVNCVYCGHRYGPEDKVPASMADALKKHIEQCPEHPMSKLRAEMEKVKAERDAAVEDLKIMALAMRESDELSEGCCFACICDAQNLPDGCILPFGECPGYEKDDCFKWRGLEGQG